MKKCLQAFKLSTFRQTGGARTSADATERTVCNLSIIIPYFNIIDYLERLLESLQGIHEDTEVIIVNDHSTENIEEWKQVQQRYADDPNFIFCDNKVGHKGGGAARNAGLEKARGKWLLFADSDDVFIDIESIYQYMDSDADLIYFPLTSIMEDGSSSTRHVHYQRIVEEYLQSPGSRKAELTLRTKYWIPTSKLVRRELVKRKHIKFDEVPYSDDLMFSTKTGLAARKIAACPNPIYCISERAGSLTKETSRRARHVRRRIEIKMLQYIFYHLDSKDRRTLYKNEYKNNLNVWISLQCQWYFYYRETFRLLRRGE